MFLHDFFFFLSFFELEYYYFFISARATDEYEFARQKVAKFVNASDYAEIVFTKNATEAINLVAYSWGLANLKEGDEVYIVFLLICNSYWIRSLFCWDNVLL